MNCRMEEMMKDLQEFVKIKVVNVHIGKEIQNSEWRVLSRIAI